jgi:glycosyltransferase involved in cell wall biosynthesis
LYPTGFEPYKNHETLLVAYRIYRKTATYGPLGMVLAGAGNAYSEHLREIARVLGIAEWVTFADAIPPGCLRHSCKPGVCLVWPSLYEGFSVPLMEAVSMGIPIIAGSHTAIPEIVGQGAVFTEVRNPLELAAAMGRAVGDGSLGNRMGGNTHSLAASRPEDSAAETLHGALLRAIRLAKVGHEDRI